MTPQTTRIAVGTGTNQAAGPMTSTTIATRRTHLEVRLFQPNIEFWRHPTIGSHTTIAGVCKISRRLSRKGLIAEDKATRQPGFDVLPEYYAKRCGG
jgi:hypothetical protein